MSDPAPKGPSGSASWEARRTGAGYSRPLEVLLTPDAANDELAASGRRRVYYCLPKVPLLARDGAGDPVFSLTLVLSRQPNPDDETIAPLIEQGVLSFDVTLAVPTEAYAELQDREDAEYRPLFAREAIFSMAMEDSEQAVGEASASGADARIALSATLGRPEALDVLTALDDVASGIKAHTSISYGAVVPERTLRLYGSWADVHDFLSAHLDTSGQVMRAELHGYFAGMLKSGVLCVFETSSSGHEERVLESDPTPFFDAFMQNSFVVLERLTPELEPRNEENRYALRARPDPTFYLNYKQKLGGFQERSVSLDAPLDEIIGGALEGQDRSRFIHLVCPKTGGGFGPAPRRVRISETRVRDAQHAGQTELALVEGTVQSVALALKPTAATGEPWRLLASDMVTLAGVIGNTRYWWVDDVTFDPTERPRNLPVVDGLDAPIWPDRLQASRYWYAPSFKVVEHRTEANPESSPFRYTYKGSDVAASGKPVRNDSVQFTLGKFINSDIRSALKGFEYNEVHPLSTSNMSVSLELTFTDERDGRTKSVTFVGQVTRAGDDVMVTVNLTDKWARLCHGALYQPNFQSGAARLHISYTIEAYFPLARSTPVVAAGAVSRTPVVYSSAETAAMDGRFYFDAVEAAYQYPGGEVRFEREAGRSDRRASSSSAAALQPGSTARSPAESPKCLGELNPGDEGPLYAERTLVCEESLQLGYFRDRLGADYPEAPTIRDFGEIEKRNTDSGATRSRDSERIEDHVARSSSSGYEEVPEVSDPKYCRVYRSLENGYQFLVVPTYYRITRYHPSVKDKAYRPAVIIYSSVQSQDPAKNRYIFEMTLQPDLPDYILSDVTARLRERFPADSDHTVLWFPDYRQNLQYLHEILDTEIEYVWTLDENIGVGVNVARMPDSFRLTLTTDLGGAALTMAVLERSGIYGNVRLKLRNGQVLESALALELGNIVGPFEIGPLKLSYWGEDPPKITNQIERSIYVQRVDVAYRDADYKKVMLSYNVGVELAPYGSGSSSETTIEEFYPPATVGHWGPWVFYRISEGPVKVEEIRCFIEDIKLNVIFIDQVNHADHGLQGLQVQARIKDVAGTITVPLTGNPPSGEANFVLPVTTYLEQHILQFQVTKTFATGNVQTTAWLDFDLGKSGIVGLTWDMIS